MVQIHFKLTYDLSAFYRPRAKNRTNNCDRQVDFKKEFFKTRVGMECTGFQNNRHHRLRGDLAKAGKRWWGGRHRQATV